MRDTSFRTYRLNASGTGPVVEIARAGDCPLRVLIRVRGAAGTIAAIGLSQGDTKTLESDGTHANCYTIPNGEADVFVLSPGQQLYAIGSVAGVKISVTISETSCGAAA